MERDQVNFQNIIKVKEVAIDYQVNKHIAAGWKLLNILTKEYGEPNRTHEYSVYVLGWDKTTQGKECREWDKDGWEIEDPLKEYRDGISEDNN